MKGLPSFKHGVHPPENKDITSGIASKRFPFPKEVILPLSQHIGTPAKALVKAGDHVERGDVIAEAAGFISSTVHATAAGTVRSSSSGLTPMAKWYRRSASPWIKVHHRCAGTVWFPAGRM